MNATRTTGLLEAAAAVAAFIGGAKDRLGRPDPAGDKTTHDARERVRALATQYGVQGNHPTYLDQCAALLRAAMAADAEPPIRTSSARAAPPNAGKAWTEETDAMLCALFERGVDLKSIAEATGRTRFGVEARLIKLGKLPVPAAGRFGSAA